MRCFPYPSLDPAVEGGRGEKGGMELGGRGAEDTEAELRNHGVDEVGTATDGGADNAQDGDGLEAHGRSIEAQYFHDYDCHGQ